jgi:branched-subunit amino acid transport protein
MSGHVTIWWTIVGLTVATVLLKAAGPVVFGGREPHPAFLRVVAMMAPALLAALVITSALADGRQISAGADTVGVLAGGLLLWRGRSVLLAVVVAVVVTAGLRAVT